jgi:hypothetical protein
MDLEKAIQQLKIEKEKLERAIASALGRSYPPVLSRNDPGGLRRAS